MKQGLLKRAPLLLLLLGALFVWQGGFGLWPVERTITWRLWGDYGSIRRVDVQLYEGDVLLTRAELEFPRGVMMDPSTKVTLKKGSYVAKVLVWRSGAVEPQIHEEAFTVDASTGSLTVP